MGVSLNGGTPKSSILIGFSIINHPFWWFPPYFRKPPYSNPYTWPYKQMGHPKPGMILQDSKPQAQSR